MYLIEDEKEVDTFKIELQTYCPDVKMPISRKGFIGFKYCDTQYDIFEIIFYNTYDTFPLTAFEFYAIDYLPKPILKDTLIRAVDKVRQKQHKQVDLQNIELLLANMRVCFLGYCLLLEHSPYI